MTASGRIRLARKPACCAIRCLNLLDVIYALNTAVIFAGQNRQRRNRKRLNNMLKPFARPHNGRRSHSPGGIPCFSREDTLGGKRASVTGLGARPRYAVEPPNKGMQRTAPAPSQAHAACNSYRSSFHKREKWAIMFSCRGSFSKRRALASGAPFAARCRSRLRAGAAAELQRWAALGESDALLEQQ